MQLHPGPQWRIFHIFTREDIISHFFMVVCANSQFAYIIQRKLHWFDDVNFILVFYFHVENNILLLCCARL